MCIHRTSHVLHVRPFAQNASSFHGKTSLLLCRATPELWHGSGAKVSPFLLDARYSFTVCYKQLVKSMTRYGIELSHGTHHNPKELLATSYAGNTGGGGGGGGVTHGTHSDHKQVCGHPVDQKGQLRHLTLTNWTSFT